MFGARRAEKSKQSSNKTLSQVGLFDIPDNFNVDVDNFDGDDDNDSDLEAELAAITSGSKPKRRPKPKPVVPAVDLDAMVADSMKDIGSDEDVSDTEDPDILNELNEITQEGTDEEEEVKKQEPPATQRSTDLVTVLKERMEMYALAEVNAKKAGETSRARRFNRGIKTLKDLLKQAQAGRPINEEDIPPVVSIHAGSAPPPPVTSENVEPIIDTEPVPDSKPDPVPSISTSVDPQKVKLLETLQDRKNQYKSAALQAKKSGDSVTAIKYIKIAKQFDAVITAVENDQAVDLSNMPGPPDGSSGIVLPQKEECEKQQSLNPEPVPMQDQPIVEEDDVPPPDLITANSVTEALQQHLKKYKSVEQQAKEEGNNSKARRIGRIIKQYEQAIKLNNAGKPFPVEDLPTPPGYAPIPVKGTEPVAPPPLVPKRAAPAVPQKKPEPDDSEKQPLTPDRNNSIRKGGNQASTSFNEKQLALLLARQKEFKEQALNAKKKGEISQAKEFLRTAKGFEPLIEAARCGLPVDMTTVPIPTSARSELEDSFQFVSAEDCAEDGVNDITSRLESQLGKQLKLCISTRDHHKALGDVAGSNRFEQLALSVTRDLDIVRVAKRTGNDPPAFHYEQKNFSVVQCCTDLTDDELELTIARGINYRCSNPKEVDTYVKFEFPFPQEDTYKDRTPLVKDTNNPEYNTKFVIPIQRNLRACQRVFKRYGVKLEVYSRGCPGNLWCASAWNCICSGLFRSDSLLGTVNVKLQPLETKCELHDSFDLLDGRKPVGGKLEVRIRIRNPILTKQVEQLSEKWLIIDGH